MITATLEPIFAAVFAFVLLSERLSPFQIAGGLLVITAIVMLQVQKEHTGLSPAALREKSRGER
jgi:drug/metabolite transporter (DMT)-like permease